MSRPPDPIENSERKRRDLRNRRAGIEASNAGPVNKHGLAAPAGAPGGQIPAAKANAAEDDRHWAAIRRRLAEMELQRGVSADDDRDWAEIRRRLAEAEQRRRVKDTLSPAEAHALAQAAGAKAGAEKMRFEQAAPDQARRREEAEGKLREAAEQRLLVAQEAKAAADAKLAAEREAEELARKLAEAELRERGERAAAAQSEARQAAEHAAAELARRQLALARISANWRRYSRPSALVALALALGAGASALWMQTTVQNGAATSPGPAAVQHGTPAAQTAVAGALLLKIDADAAGFAARAASKGRR